MNQPGSDKAISENIAPVIEAVAERIHYAEGRRVNYTVMAVALIAGGISVLVFAFGSIGEMWLKYSALTASVGFILVGLFVIYTYGRQTNQYPYTSATKTWKWFYRDALPNKDAFALKTFELPASRKSRITAAYSAQLPVFKAQIATLTSDELNADQNIEQLYSLHVNELYKNAYLSRLRTIFNWGLIGTILAAFISGIWGEYLEAQASTLQTETYSGRGWSQRVEYRLISEPLADWADVAIHVAVTNNSEKPISVSGLVVRDSSGWPLPVEVKFQRPFPPNIAPRARGDAYASIHATRAVWRERASLKAELK